MITAIVGKVGVGKTSLATAIAGEYMTEKAFENRAECKALVKRMNRGGFNYSVPPQHLVYSDFFMIGRKDGFKPRVSYAIDGFTFGLPNDQMDTAFLPPYSKIFFDECQKILNSRDYKNLPDWISRAYELHRHNRFDIWLVCQREGLIDLNVREIVGKFILVKDIKHKQNEFGDIEKTTWHVREFASMQDYENYAYNGQSEKLGKDGTYTYLGNIYQNYDSYNFFSFWYKDMYSRDFDRTPNMPTVYTLEAVQAFNEYNSYMRPLFRKERNYYGV